MANLEQKSQREFDAAPVSGKRRLKRSLVVGVVLVNGLAVAGVAYALSNLGAPPAAAAAPDEAPARPAEPAAAAKPGTTVKLDPFIVNLTDADKPRYLKLELTLNVAGDKAKREADERQADVRNVIIAYLSSLTPQQTVGQLGKEEMAFALKNKVNALLPSRGVERVLFTQFIVH